MNELKKNFPGILLAAVIAGIAYVGVGYTGVLNVEVWALFIGLILGNIKALPGQFVSGMKFSGKKILNTAVALMGLQFAFSQIPIHFSSLLVLVFLIVASSMIGFYVARRIGILPSCGLMIGIGNAVCGASAIAAVSPFVQQEDHETGVAVGVVNVLGSIAMVTMPLLVVALSLNDFEASFLIGGTLQAVGQAVGAGYAVNETVGEWATLIKMTRVSLLIPVVLFLAIRKGRNTGGGMKAVRRAFPNFLIIFLLLLVFTNLVDLPSEILGTVKTIDKAFLTVAMAGLGFQINFSDIRNQGARALSLGVAIYSVQVLVVLAVIYSGLL
jgi:uncharacterized integral membrane protein (TIGR00698 family)